MRGAELFVQCLRAAGIRCVYGIPGEENTDLMLALKESEIDFVLTRHEQSAAFMAATHAQLTGNLAACLSTLGPGATNMVTGVAHAQLDRIPLLAITARGERGRIGITESHQVIDLDALMAPVTKFSRSIMLTEEIPGAVAEAVRRAFASPPGAVHLSLPVDIAAADTAGRPASVPPYYPPRPSPEAIADVAAHLSKARQPILVAGAGTIRAGAAGALAAFAQTHDLPLATTFMAKGILPADDPRTLFAAGQPSKDHIDIALAKADCLIAVGYDAIEYAPAQLTDGSQPVIVVNDEASPADLEWHIVAEAVGDIRATLAALGEELGERRWKVFPAARAARGAMVEERSTCKTAPGAPILCPEDILARLERRLQPEDTVISGVGTHKMKVARTLHPKRAGQLVIANGLAGMGLALPGAIAAALVRKTGRVYAIAGDGEFLMNVQEMETASRLGSPITVLLWEDGGYGLIELKEQEDRGRHVDLSFGNPQWAELCRAFAWRHLPVARFDALDTALEHATAGEGPALVTMKVDYGESLSAK